MRQGGYKIINLKGINITSQGVKIDGIYESIKGTRKPTVLSGLVTNSTEYPDMAVLFKLDTDGSYKYSFVYNGYSIALTVTKEDVVSARVSPRA